jgi:glyoxylase-like metal-dependent hydrolase (beta-lactamase superfamily II)
VRRLLLLTAFFATSLPAQEPLRSASGALALLDSAIAANGGVARLRALEDVTMKYRGTRWMYYQSEKLSRPWSTVKTEIDLVIDVKGGRLHRRGVNRYPKDFVFEGVSVTTPTAFWNWDPNRAGLGDAFAKFPGSSIANHSQRRELPALQLLRIRDYPESVRSLGTQAKDGRRLSGLSYAEGNGAIYEVWIDAATKYLTRLSWLRDDPVEGDQVASYTYSGYRVEKGIPVPSRLVERWNDEVMRDDSLEISIDSRPADSWFVPPASGFAEITDTRLTGPESEPLRKLADNVWLLQSLPGGNRVMFVAFRDHVLVLEAPTPQNAATAVMDAVRRTVPGKPIRYVAMTHHHDDHGGGLRPYIAEGITIVTTPTNRPFVESVASAKHTIRPDALSATPRQPMIEIFTRKRVFTDGAMTVELHDIGPTSHVDEIVLAYLPNEKLVFQGDLIILPARGEVDPANRLTEEFFDAVTRLKLDVQTIAGVHGRVGTVDDLRRAVALRRLR